MKYNGYIIEPEDDPWAIKYGSKIKFYLDSLYGERVYHADSEEDAKEQIDEIESPIFI